MDPIKYIFEKPAVTGRIARWQMLLSEYDIEYRAQKAIKGSILADHLAHQPIEDYQSVQYDFPDEKILYLKMKDCDKPILDEGPEPGSKWSMVFDGAINQYGNGIGAVIITPQGKPSTTCLLKHRVSRLTISELLAQIVDGILFLPDSSC